MKKVSKFQFLYSTISLFGCTGFLFAQKSDSLSSKTIQEIILNRKIQETGVISSQKLSGKELENMNSNSVADAIRYFSGVQLKDYGGIGGMKTVNIRGMGTQHVGVFYDGIQLNNAQNGTVDLGRFSLDNLESISLYNGQKSEIFQAAKDFGSAGSIYLKSRRPTFLGSKKTNVNLNYRSGSFGVVNPSILVEQKLTDQISISLNTEYLTADGEYKFYQRTALPNGNLASERKGIRTNGDIGAIRAEVGVFGKINNGSWNLKSYLYDSERGIPGAVVKNVSIFSSRQWDKNFFVQGSLEKEISSKYKFLVNAKFAIDDLHYLNDNPSGTPILIDNTYQQKEIYVSTAQQYSPYDFWKINLSFDYQYNTLDANLREFAYPTRNTELLALATELTFNRFKFQGSILGTFVQEEIENTKFSVPQNRTEFTPAFFASYQPFASKNFKVHGFYKRIFRMPTFNDLYYTDIGSSQLKPEFTNQYDLGLVFNKDFESGILKNLNFLTDVYYNQVQDKIVAFPAGQQFRWTMVNLGDVEIKGLDISSQAVWLIANDLLFSTRFTYTFEEAPDMTKTKGYFKDQIPYIPRNSGSAILGLTYKDWQLNYSFLYVGERHNMSENIPENYEQPWYTSDISGSKEFKLEKVSFKLGLEVNNLLNQNYSVIRNFPMPGRNFRASLRVQF